MNPALVFVPKKKCCRSTPRCGRCPVVLKARARAREGRAALVEAVLYGQARPIPASVEHALLELSAARGST